MVYDMRHYPCRWGHCFEFRVNIPCCLESESVSNITVLGFRYCSYLQYVSTLDTKRRKCIVKFSVSFWSFYYSCRADHVRLFSGYNLSHVVFRGVFWHDSLMVLTWRPIVDSIKSS